MNLVPKADGHDACAIVTISRPEHCTMHFSVELPSMLYIVLTSKPLKYCSIHHDYCSITMPHQCIHAFVKHVAAM